MINSAMKCAQPMLAPGSLPVSLSKLNDRTRQTTPGALEAEPSPRKAHLGQGNHRQAAQRNPTRREHLKREGEHPNSTRDREHLAMAPYRVTVVGVELAHAQIPCSSRQPPENPTALEVAYNPGVLSIVLLYLQVLSWFFKGGKMLRER